ncbi:glycosyltransferase family 4 protein [Clostridium gasigenes]|uniref:glycosyltransferase family 4 protein n=1 Tax=Clostridium gasigenes TaxID=94869 RepID=UPI001C0ADC3F|nr:glycosyltransferase family 4 protein [Clostridium gasigenes]MBU3138159.1 glycosyltransferase family 4 protein [Clostridium gasigenes]
MNVLFISELANLGGGETSLLNLITEFNKDKSEIKPILLCFEEGKLPEESRDIRINTIIYDFKSDIRKAKIIKVIYTLKKIIKNNNIKVIQTNEWKTSVILSLINRFCFLKCKIVWVCHGQWYKFDIIKRNLINIFIDNIISVSNIVKENLLVNGIDKQKISKIPLGIDLDKFKYGDKLKIRKEFNLAEDEIVFAVVGRFQEIKGQKLVIEAAIELKKLNKKCKILFVGDSIFNNRLDDIYKQESLDLIKENELEDYFIFLGVRRDIPDILSSIDALIIPSVNESFGMVVIEAFASQCLVISTPCDGPKEIIKDGYSGFILLERKESYLTDRIESIIDKKIDLSTIAQCQKKQVEKYSIKSISILYKKLYKYYM